MALTPEASIVKITLDGANPASEQAQFVVQFSGRSALSAAEAWDLAERLLASDLASGLAFTPVSVSAVTQERVEILEEPTP